mmetsp:Transcript_50225/g.156984  ORF Transcript_50225/g.156984 Transcript_50225/m.156984 type:complete len:214 (+) Transcript_50225:514-1155(+)
MVPGSAERDSFAPPTTSAIADPLPLERMLRKVSLEESQIPSLSQTSLKKGTLKLIGRVTRCTSIPLKISEKPTPSVPNVAIAPKLMIPWGWYPKMYFCSGSSWAVGMSEIGKYSPKCFHQLSRRNQSDFFDPVVGDLSRKMWTRYAAMKTLTRGANISVSDVHIQPSETGRAYTKEATAAVCILRCHGTLKMDIKLSPSPLRDTCASFTLLHQ